MKLEAEHMVVITLICVAIFVILLITGCDNKETDCWNYPLFGECTHLMNKQLNGWTDNINTTCECISDGKGNINFTWQKRNTLSIQDKKTLAKIAYNWYCICEENYKHHECERDKEPTIYNNNCKWYGWHDTTEQKTRIKEIKWNY